MTMHGYFHLIEGETIISKVFVTASIPLKQKAAVDTGLELLFQLVPTVLLSRRRSYLQQVNSTELELLHRSVLQSVNLSHN